jgi:hypothetical protein
MSPAVSGGVCNHRQEGRLGHVLQFGQRKTNLAIVLAGCGLTSRATRTRRLVGSPY